MDNLAEVLLNGIGYGLGKSPTSTRSMFEIRMSSVLLPRAYLPGLSVRNASQLVSLGICRLMSNRGLKGSVLQQKMLL